MIERAATISAWLRKEREFSFYGDIDATPTSTTRKRSALTGAAVRSCESVGSRRLLTRFEERGVLGISRSGPAGLRDFLEAEEVGLRRNAQERRA